MIPTKFENKSLSIAPCEGKKPISILNDKYCEELAHPYLLPTGQFGYNVDRIAKLSPNKYFNQRLLVKLQANICIRGGLYILCTCGLPATQYN